MVFEAIPASSSGRSSGPPSAAFRLSPRLSSASLSPCSSSSKTRQSERSAVRAEQWQSSRSLADSQESRRPSARALLFVLLQTFRQLLIHWNHAVSHDSPEVADLSEHAEQGPDVYFSTLYYVANGTHLAYRRG